MKNWLTSGNGESVSATVGLPDDPVPIEQDYEMVPVDRLLTHPDNARKGSLEAIRESIRTNGFYGACVVQRSTGRILVGNHRYLAAVEEGLTEVPVVWVDKSDDEARRLLLVDNRSTDLSAYDDNLLSILLTAVADDDTGLVGSGYTDDDMAVLLSTLEAVEPVTDLDYGLSMDDGLTPAERLESWQESGIRSIILPYPLGEYDEVVAALTKVRSDHDVDTNAAALRCLLGL
jgi:hypothetical protein